MRLWVVKFGTPRSDDCHIPCYRLIARASALLQQLLRNVLIPAIIRLHRAGAFEGLFHLFAFSVTCQAARLRQKSAATCVAISGIVSTVAAVAYSAGLHARAGVAGVEELSRALSGIALSMCGMGVHEIK